jgi:hypothetical protein
MIFGANSGHNNVANSLIKARGITIDNYKESGEGELPVLFLGDLKAVSQSGFGLYCDNVYLNGSLTTKSDGSYAGINTKSTIKSTHFTDENKNENIIIWAGDRYMIGESEESNEKGDDELLQGANFYVTDKGGLFAKKARIENALWVNGSITGVNIYAATISGGTED